MAEQFQQLKCLSEPQGLYNGKETEHAGAELCQAKVKLG